MKDETVSSKQKRRKIEANIPIRAYPSNLSNRPPANEA
jgi:hypothetical protein